ncbi:MAG TPA: radical SAM protein [Pyrinomonadaceae bacterium]|jgi:MoaA/NifB/PqqE/SkfB family radical SAM enzyme|nr:radical SAM protein [Pyrinomonadaceae bacterium]
MNPDSQAPADAVRPRDYGPPRLIVELTNICNLHCGYCLRDQDALYHDPANFFPVELLRRVVREAREHMNASQVMFTGGETTLHPNFREVVEAVGAEGIKCSFVTNGWHFERVWPAVVANRETVSHVAFSLDGATREAHDRWRGEGSFVRLVRAFARCRAAKLPFVVKVGLRRDTLPQLEQVALFAARMGASSLSFGHVLPTSAEFERELALDPDERTAAEQEVAVLASILKMRVTNEVGYFNTDPAAPCSALAGVSCNIDYRGRLSLCCNLSGYRGASGEPDVVADLNEESFASAFERLRRLAEEQTERRRVALAEHAQRNAKPDVYLGSPCLFCLKSFGKLPWHADETRDARTLPVLQAV